MEQKIEPVEVAPVIKLAQQTIRLSLSHFYKTQEAEQNILKCIGHIEDDTDRLLLYFSKNESWQLLFKFF